MKKENAFLQKLDKIGNLTQVVCLSLFLTGVSVQGVSAETGFPISQSVQQTKTVTGQVVDETGEPVIGASVVVEGTTNGTITDFDGKYTLEADANSILVFSYLSMKTIEEPVNGRTKIDVTMVSDAEALDEVVVTAMGIKRESKTLTYSAQTVGGKDLNEIKNVNMINSLQGKSAGLQITPNSTGAGGSSKILFRGNKSISGSNQPLIVVDGVSGVDISSVNPNDIESMQVLKDASATAIYGAHCLLYTSDAADE